MVLKIAGLIGVAALFVLALAALSAFSGLIIWLLWNALVPALFGGPAITFVQGILIGVALSVVGSFFRSSNTKSK